MIQTENRAPSVLSIKRQDRPSDYTSGDSFPAITRASQFFGPTGFPTVIYRIVPPPWVASYSIELYELVQDTVVPVALPDSLATPITGTSPTIRQRTNNAPVALRITDVVEIGEDAPYDSFSTLERQFLIHRQATYDRESV